MFRVASYTEDGDRTFILIVAIYQNTWGHIAEVRNVKIDHRGNFKCHADGIPNKSKIHSEPLNIFFSVFYVSSFMPTL
jgi:hypothetical protein